MCMYRVLIPEVREVYITKYQQSFSLHSHSIFVLDALSEFAYKWMSITYAYCYGCVCVSHANITKYYNIDSLENSGDYFHDTCT